MVKNPRGYGNLGKIREAFCESTVNMLFCDDALLKTRFLSALARDDPGVLYADFDLLYSGVVHAGGAAGGGLGSCMVPRGESPAVFIAEMMERIPSARITVLDSLSGLLTMVSEEYPDRVLNTYLRMMASAAREAGASIVASGIARRRGRSWAVLPLNAEMLRDDATTFHLSHGDEGAVLIESGDRFTRRFLLEKDGG